MRLAAPLRLRDLAARHGGTLDPAVERERVLAIAPLGSAGADELAPFLSRRFLAAARSTAAILLVDARLAPLVPDARRWSHPFASWALARVLGEVAESRRADAKASVHRTATIGPGAVVMPGAVVGPGARVEPNAVIYGGVMLGARAVVGAGSVVGRPGFGWAASPEGGIVRIPQLGGVVVEDDAEIGPLCTVDAGTLSPTTIGRGARLDAQVHVGHNAAIGAGSLVAAQAGFAGSVRVDAGVQVGGQAGFADHVRVGAGARVAAKSGVIGDVPPNATVAGYPAVERGRWLRGMARVLRTTKRS